MLVTNIFFSNSVSTQKRDEFMFWVTFILSSANALNLDKAKMAKGWRIYDQIDKFNIGLGAPLDELEIWKN